MFDVRKCQNPECGLRYQMKSGEAAGERCPLCRSEAVVVVSGSGQHSIKKTQGPGRLPRVEALLDNIRSAWNVGSMFRTADGAGVQRLHLCGLTPRPDNPRVIKTALGAERSVPWLYHADGVQACMDLQSHGYRIWALEGGEKAVPISEVSLPQESPLIFVIGNEVSGVDPGILNLCERVVYLPMKGLKGSFNAAVAFGIAAYTLLRSPVFTDAE
jgi:23S rRNA (guanosine2251-2'-O)-methyltransferase